ncbi:uncharacterized protein STEHIDRAFT_106408 [Stereum hirsutum FP-91666 SS1]|uniref:Uncharacterized protein n=1 Tax=Stereum hirsutum (strain FP-91666) TaxID=721885 RepID=R7RVP4_STEHR|nr:uncharacterized protein STEHIDRAFT_106408 [Stereum hirsutum FP-91666 SS1]EIM79179.1 hypothetical protein STEHIDRAFT_106408 [Stereum hirsutum FP-91666 SS1]
MFSQPNTSSASSLGSLLSTHIPPTPSASPSKTPRKQQEPEPIRLDSIGVPPASIIGKVLVRIRPSPTHPSVNLDFEDETTFQIRVDGYNPVHSIPKTLETNDLLRPLFHPYPLPAAGQGLDVRLTVVDCRFIKMKETAYERSDTCDHEWEVQHLALAIKFEERDGWHCCWATCGVYDKRDYGPCLFRSFDDVYLQQVQKSPKSSKKQKRRPKQKKNDNDSTRQAAL